MAHPKAAQKKKEKERKEAGDEGNKTVIFDRGSFGPETIDAAIVEPVSPVGDPITSPQRFLPGVNTVQLEGVFGSKRCPLAVPDVAKYHRTTLSRPSRHVPYVHIAVLFVTDGERTLFCPNSPDPPVRRTNGEIQVWDLMGRILFETLRRSASSPVEQKGQEQEGETQVQNPKPVGYGSLGGAAGGGRHGVRKGKQEENDEEQQRAPHLGKDHQLFWPPSAGATDSKSVPNPSPA
jgi:hypothetical protein